MRTERMDRMFCICVFFIKLFPPSRIVKTLKDYVLTYDLKTSYSFKILLMRTLPKVL